MKQFNRKQIPVCRACHIIIICHSGKSDGIALNKLKKTKPKIPEIII